jgi:uncharacterized protein (DUF305 family)
MRLLAGRGAVGLLVVVVGVACRTAGREAGAPIVQPGAPGQPSQAITPEAATDLSGVAFTDADVRFMQGMIHHHAQALEMTAWIPSRTSREDLHLLGRRIELSQADEIGMMKAWLRDRGHEVPAGDAHHGHGTTLMPGMLTPPEMQALAGATGEEFERLFLEGMIKHHAGALVMVEDLLSSPGAGQESDIAAFAADVLADQQMEIDRMRAMLGAR